MAQDIGSVTASGGVPPLAQKSAPGSGYTAPEASATAGAAGRDAKPEPSIVNSEAIREQLAAAGAELRFETDRDTGQSVISVVDHATGTVIRQIPSEEELRLAKVLTKLAQGQVEDTA